MAVYIDGFNLIYAFEDLEELMLSNELHKARLLLLEYLKIYQKLKKKKNIIVVFDGKKDMGMNILSEFYGSIQIIYSHDDSADHVIKHFIEEDKNPKTSVVITSDKEIIHFARIYQVKNIKSDIFAKEVKSIVKEYKKKPEKSEDIQLSKQEVDYWLNEFRKRKKS